MSWFETTPIDCASCGREFLGPTAETINVGRMPDERDRILLGEFHKVRCSHCHTTFRVDRPFLYSDFGRKQFAHVFPKDEIDAWPQHEAQAEQVFHEGFELSPAGVREMAVDFRVRAIFGLDALAEKLRIWDAGLDDAVVELLKLELVTSLPELSPDSAVLVGEVTPEWIEATVRTHGTEPALYGMKMERYQELLADRDQLIEKFPGLFHKPFVSLRRLAREQVVREPALKDSLGQEA